MLLYVIIIYYLSLYLFSVFAQYCPMFQASIRNNVIPITKKGGDFIHGSVVDLPPKSVASPPDSPDGS
jgi:hypothetical protein